VSELPRLARAVKEATGGINIVQVLIIAGHDFLLSRFSASLLLRHRIMAHLQAYFIDDEASDDGDGDSDDSDQSDGDPTLGGFIVAVAGDYVDEGCGSASEPDGSAAAEGAGASAARGRTRSGRPLGA
jgi:hypothetical protein